MPFAQWIQPNMNYDQLYQELLLVPIQCKFLRTVLDQRTIVFSAIDMLRLKLRTGLSASP